MVPNAKSFAALFLRGYLARQRGDLSEARSLLENARGALGKDSVPKGGSAEGDVKAKQHVESTPLAPYWTGWNGDLDPDHAYPELAKYLEQLPGKR